MLIAARDRGQTVVTVIFNSSHEETTFWDNPAIVRRFLLSTGFRDESSPWMTIVLRGDEIELASVADRWSSKFVD